MTKKKIKKIKKFNFKNKFSYLVGIEIERAAKVSPSKDTAKQNKKTATMS
jgi:hypothetical protein